MDSQQFRQFIDQRGLELYRDMPWRQDTRVYYVLVSELMLQQTQVDRVVPKFKAFIERFPDEMCLAQASLSEVLAMWQGLGYNRRAKFLHLAAKTVVYELSGQWPDTVAGLMALPGVGKNTAGAIMAYAFDKAVVYIETNIRTVYIHHFFPTMDEIDDKQIAELLEQTLDGHHPRQFYWALMDYGAWLKRQGVKNIGQSRHYTKQSKLAGSVRQVRGQIIKALAQHSMSPLELEQLIMADERFDPALSGLVKDGLVDYNGGQLRLSD